VLASPFVRKVVIENEIGERLLVPMNWGLVQRYPGGTGLFPTTMRAESIMEDPLFRTLLLSGRCLVPMRGYFERPDRPKSSDKEAYFVSIAKEEIFAVAGMYSVSPPIDGVIAASYCMLMTEAPPELRFLGDRMPAILRNEKEETSWLSRGENDPETLLSMLRPYDGGLNISVIPSLDEAAWTLRTPGESRRQYKTSPLPMKV
jgi:putative SOS response-associated peptidase YedK